MKKSLLILLMSISLIGFTQNHEKGKFLFSGSFSGPWSDVTLPSTVGYYISDALAVTADLSLTIEGESDSYGLDLGVRYHLGDNFFLNADVQISDDGNNQTDEFPLISVGGSYAIAIKDWASIDPGLSISMQDNRTELAKMIGFSLYF